MKDIIIKKINNNLANYLVFGTTVDSPLFQLQEICAKISTSKSYVVLFDQLLQTGNSDNRYLLLHYNGSTFDFNTAKNIDSSFVELKIRKIMSDFLKHNKLLLKYSILLSSEKEKILKGDVV